MCIFTSVYTLSYIHQCITLNKPISSETKPKCACMCDTYSYVLIHAHLLFVFQMNVWTCIRSIISSISMCVCVDVVLQGCVCIDVYVCMCMVTSRVFVLENKVTSMTYLHTAFPHQHHTRVQYKLCVPQNKRISTKTNAKCACMCVSVYTYSHILIYAHVVSFFYMKIQIYAIRISICKYINTYI